MSVKEVKVKVQPIRLKSALEIWDSDKTPVAKDAWVHGPKKPRDVIRGEEPSPCDVSLEALARQGLVELLPPIIIEKRDDVRKVPNDVDLVVINDSGDWFADNGILDELAALGKPIAPEWDSWGYAIHGRISKFRLRKYAKVLRFIPMGVNDVQALIRALRAYRFIRTMRVLYIGTYPSHSVAIGPGIDFDYLKQRFGTEFKKVDIDEYVKAIDEIPDEDVKSIVEEWRRRFIILDNREKKLTLYAKIYKALKLLLQRYNANALTVDCAALPDLEFVPCVAYSLLIDDGIPCSCEADIPALITMAILMGVSGGPVLMGNLNENATHVDIEQNIVVVNHDVVPTTMIAPSCSVYMRDYHAMGKGSTLYGELPANTIVTLAGMNWDMDTIWVTTGTIKWTQDTVHCRIAVGIKVHDAKKVSKDAASHHVVMAFGNYVEEIKIVAKLLGIEFTQL